jgi:dolichol-phosphate mannosyltransferase
MNKNNKQIDISIVIPVYGCASCLDELHKRLVIVLNSLVNNYEIILVEDASPDDSWQRILQLTKNNSSVKGIRLSRNFGQHKAITAGLDFATGEWIVVMDCDLQDKPEEIIKLYKKAISGYDIVFARRYDRKDSYLKKLGSKLFYKFMSYMTNTKLDPAIANFGIYNKKVINAVKGMRENLRYFPVMVKWVGFESTTIDVVHSERHSGKSSYSLKKLINISVDVVVSFTEKPLKLMVCTGVFISILSALYALYILVGAIAGNIKIEGWASVMVSIWFISGVLMSMLGVVGVYVGKAFNETKKDHSTLFQKQCGVRTDDSIFGMGK